MKTIEIVVDPQGKTRLKTDGFPGAECRSASAPLARALGITTSDRPTAEAYQVRPSVQRQAEQRP